MEGEAILDVNAPNIMSIVIMGVIGFAVIGLVLKVIAKAKGASSNA